MLEIGLAIWDKVPPVARRTNPNMAAVIGLVFGGIGLGIYFRNVLDTLVPVAIAVILGLMIGDVGVVGGIVLAGMYGYMRSLESNDRLTASATTPDVHVP